MKFQVSMGSDCREVREGHREELSTNIVILSAEFEVEPSQLWLYLTTQKGLAKWFGVVSGELSLRGGFSVKDNASGTILECVREKSIAATWEFAGDISWVHISLKKFGMKTKLILEHEMPITPSSQKHWDKFGPGASGVGWDCAFLGLKGVIESNAQSSAEQSYVWLETEDGMSALREWAVSWGTAHTQTGEDSNVAKQMALQTAAFYCGET